MIEEEIAVDQKQVCAHCGDDCKEEPILFEEKVFCCHGCQAVYELLESSDLVGYYDNDQLKASKILDRDIANRKFQALDLPEVQSSLFRYQDEVKSVVRFYLSGIHCSSCIYLLEHLPKLNPAVLRAEVNFIRKEVSLTFNHQEITLKETAVLLASLGYPPTINLDSVDGPRNKSKRSSLGMKIALAGFCFGNSMLISLPEYLDTGFQLDENLKMLFGWVNIIMALPVVFYASQDYFSSSWKGLKHGYLNIDLPISLGIITLFARSMYEILWAVGPGYVDSLTGLVFFLLLGKWYQGKTYEALSFDRDYTSYFPISVLRLTDSGEETVMLKNLKVGDRIIIHNQELVPADGVIEEGEAKLDYSFVTGESDPTLKYAGDKIFAGGRQIGGQLVVKLEKAVNNSELTQMWNNQPSENERVNNYDQLIDRVSKYFTIVVVMLALGTGVYWQISDPSKVWDAVTAVLIVACPCALALALPFAFGHAMRILGSQGIYLKNANVVEAVSHIREIVFDKTGTLTKNNPLSLTFNGKSLTEEEKSLIKTVTSNSAHPLSKIITDHFDRSTKKLPISAFEEEIGKGVIAEVEGNAIRIGSAVWLDVESIHSSNNEIRVYIQINGWNRGYYAIQVEYREGVFEELKLLRDHYKLHLLSGDKETEQQTLSPYFDSLNFNQKPLDKHEYVQGLSQSVLMIGDGLNDAGALNAADVGFAVCEDIHQFSPACHAMVSADAVPSIGNVLKFSKSAMTVVVIALTMAFVYNVIGLSFAVSGNLTPIISAILMPVSSVTVVGFITLAVNWLARKTFS
ncbi:heavy metal translocating P-type ATPase metal-binding domain-containing protein [Marinoscillum sp. MHG1-6]|uniref:heavy metal translocating P-type ATPase n=1 Tax=Marinoscillum sp. MHG1-6 TaxID=2959627 RepID=UPI0021577973|nr:heavy metal translocating P-type ATPase metal-binding domain-containing protein [Marinoscillum sp. MHG1-6]